MRNTLIMNVIGTVKVFQPCKVKMVELGSKNAGISELFLCNPGGNINTDFVYYKYHGASVSGQYYYDGIVFNDGFFVTTQGAQFGNAVIEYELLRYPAQ